MKRTILILAAGVLLLAAAGCKDENKPVITRIFASPACGVAPLQIEAYGVASGGNETGEATGGNNNLEFRWDFGDGATGSTAISYHTYRVPGEYTVSLRVEDPDGESAVRSVPVVVYADSLFVEATSSATGPVTTADTVSFDYRSGTCGVDADSESDRSSYLEQRWLMHDPGFTGGGVYRGPTPRHTFSAPGTYDVELIVTYTGWAVTRRDTVTVVVQ
ncbi:MAG: PKD domain-containing protein [Candidatus Krumholzibacteriia bacterium]